MSVATKRPSVGRVLLIGAGPGDPGLLTVRALRALKHCDVIAYDALISPAILAQANPQSEMICVGHRNHEKSKFGSRKLSYGMHPAVIEAAMAGKSVARLKSGDPFVFGRGYEECHDLRHHQIPYEVIPGVTSSLGASGALGIPLTQRLVASDVTFASGHDLLDLKKSQSNWSAICQSKGTLVLFMVKSRLRENLEKLRALGKGDDTPIAYVEAATSYNQKSIVGTLKTIADKVERQAKSNSPSLVIIGEVVKKSNDLAWQKTVALSGKRILVLRSRAGRSALAEQLASLGAEVVEAPYVRSDFSPAKHLWTRINKCFLEKKCSSLLFPSAESVEAFFVALKGAGVDVRSLFGVQMVCIGALARSALSSRGLCPSLELKGFCAKGLSPLFEEKSRVHLVLTRLNAHKGLLKSLKDGGISFEAMPAYASHHIFPDFEPGHFDYVAAASSSSLELLAKSPWFRHVSNAQFVAIGPKSLAKCAEMGMMKRQMADEDTIEALVGKIVEHATIASNNRKEVSAVPAACA